MLVSVRIYDNKPWEMIMKVHKNKILTFVNIYTYVNMYIFFKCCSDTKMCTHFFYGIKDETRPRA